MPYVTARVLALLIYVLTVAVWSTPPMLYSKAVFLSSVLIQHVYLKRGTMVQCVVPVADISSTP